jgi:hypothetical protein
MAKRQKYQIEKTSVGMQYVFPGAERIAPVVTPSMQYVADSTQFLIPSAEQISTGELLMQKMPVARPSSAPLVEKTVLN